MRGCIGNQKIKLLMGVGQKKKSCEKVGPKYSLGGIQNVWRSAFNLGERKKSCGLGGCKNNRRWGMRKTYLGGCHPKNKMCSRGIREKNIWGGLVKLSILHPSRMLDGRASPLTCHLDRFDLWPWGTNSNGLPGNGFSLRHLLTFLMSWGNVISLSFGTKSSKSSFPVCVELAFSSPLDEELPTPGTNHILQNNCKYLFYFYYMFHAFL